MSLTILLTGASGFIGSAFLKAASVKGYRVKAITRKLVPQQSEMALEFYNVDLLSDFNWNELLFDVDVVVHTAGEINDVSLMRQLNYEASLKLLRSAINCRVKRWIQVSSVGAYGLVQNGLVNESWDECPVNLYEETKSNFDVRLTEVAKHASLETCIVRPSNVYGPGMRNQSIQQMLGAIKKGLFAYIGPHGASANYVHVQDVVQALDLCVMHPKAANQTYIVSAWATIEDMASGLAMGVGLNPPYFRVPLCVASLLAKMMQWWSRWPLTLSRVQAMSVRARYSTEKIEKELGWRLSVPVKEGMREFARDLLQ